MNDEVQPLAKPVLTKWHLTTWGIGQIIQYCDYSAVPLAHLLTWPPHDVARVHSIS